MDLALALALALALDLALALALALALDLTLDLTLALALALDLDRVFFLSVKLIFLTFVFFLCIGDLSILDVDSNLFSNGILVISKCSCINIDTSPINPANSGRIASLFSSVIVIFSFSRNRTMYSRIVIRKSLF